MQKNTSRRKFLETTAGGFAGLALSQILRAETANGSALHHRPKAKRVIQLFMNGGVSQMDTFDYKRSLEELDGKTFDPGDGRLVESVTKSPGFNSFRT